jgi:hypothetical protein
MASDNQVNIISESAGVSNDSGFFRRFFNNKKIITFGIIGVIFIIAFVFIYFFISSGRFVKEGGKVSQKTTEGENAFLIELAEIEASKQGGLVSVAQIEGKTSILVELDAVLSAEEQPVNVYRGACPDPGSDIAYELNKIVNGESETIINFSIEEINRNKPLAIAVGKSFEEEGAPVSCANF